MGGGYVNVLEYACENEELIMEDILLMLLKSASFQSVYLALSKIKDVYKQEKLKQKLFSDFVFVKESDDLHLNSLPILEESEVSSFFFNSLEITENFDEKQICQYVIEGKEEELRDLLDKGLSPDYVFTQDIIINDFLCSKGTSLLLLTLKICIKNDASYFLYGVIALLLEKGVDLEKECLEINPLDYLCENEPFFLKEIVLCLLTSVSKQKAFAALAKVSNINRRKKLEEILNSNTSFFQFDSNLEIEQEIVKQNLSNTEEQFEVSGTVSNEHISSLADISTSQLPQVIEKVLLKDFFYLEEILKNQCLLKEFNNKIQEKDDKETFFSFLISEVKDEYIRHEICLLFLKYGYTPKTIVRQNINLISFLFSLRRSSSFIKNSGILMETLCAIFFLFKEGDNLSSLLERINNRDQEQLTDFFIKKGTNKFSKSLINFINLMKLNSSKGPGYVFYYPLLKGFLDVSLTLNKNVITEESLNIQYFFPILDHIKDKLCNILQQTHHEQRRRKKYLIDLLESLLKITVNKNNFCKDIQNFYNDWFKKEIISFNNSDVEKEVLKLIYKYWGSFLDNSNKYRRTISSLNLFINEPLTVTNVFENQIHKTNKLETVIQKVFIKDFSLLEKILTNPSFLTEYDDEVRLINNQETLFSVLISEVKDEYIRHEICLLFLKYGYTPKTIVSNNTDLISFLCNLRRKAPSSSQSILQGILLKTLCSVFFLFEEGSSISYVFDKLIYGKDKKFLRKCFTYGKEDLFSKQFINFIILFKKDKNHNCTYYPLLKGFLDVSLALNKNVITETPWTIKYIFPILDYIKSRLCSILQQIHREQIEKKVCFLEIFEDLLKVTIHKNSCNEEKPILYNFWFKQQYFDFNNLEIKDEFLKLIQKYWKNFLDQENQITLDKSITNLQKRKREEEDIVLTKRKKS